MENSEDDEDHDNFEDLVYDIDRKDQAEEEKNNIYVEMFVNMNLN